MAFNKVSLKQCALATVVLLLVLKEINSTLLKDLLLADAGEGLSRPPREAQYRLDRHAAPTTTQTVSSARPIKPEDSNDARDRDSLEKRCARCDSYYYNRDNRPYPYDSRTNYDDRYDDRYREKDRNYDDRYRDRVYDDYDRRYYDTDRRYNDYDRDRYDRDRYERRPDSYDRYEKYDRNNVRYYDRDRYDRGDANRYSTNRYDSVGYRPWDETTRGSSGFDNNGRGYYFSVGRPEYSSGYGSGGYASNWNYSRDDDRDRGWREQGFVSGPSRPRDPYDPGYRGTSYLYGRPSSSTTTELPNPLGGNSDSDRPQSQDNSGTG